MSDNPKVLRTIFHDRHVASGAKMVDFAGWDMPVQYPSGIVAEHLATRRGCGLFDVSHMGRFILSGADALAFAQHLLTNNAAALEPGKAQYTIIPNAAGGAIDDAYLYRFFEESYLLVVNASNRAKDWDHFQAELVKFDDVKLTDRTSELAMLSLQGPKSKNILTGLIESGHLPEPKRNSLSVVQIGGAEVLLARTGYTGEPLCFELFIENASAPAIWDALTAAGAEPVGLGARDTLRLEANLPLYGHELGDDPAGGEIPIFACPLAKFAVSFSPAKGDFVGKAAIRKQYEAFRRFAFGDYSRIADLPRIVRPVSLIAKGVARAGAKIFSGDEGEHAGWVTSGTVVPYWKTEGEALASKLTDEKGMRAICLALLDSDIQDEDRVQVEIRGRKIEAVIVPYHLRSEAPPLARPVVYGEPHVEEPAPPSEPVKQVQALLAKTVGNTIWRQQECINLIPSEQTTSPMVRLLSAMDPAFRYAEHKEVKAFYDADVFYYQGVDFICEVERLLEQELRRYLGCRQVETRAVSGQMANTIVFSAMIDYLNRASRKEQPRRIRSVMNNDIIRGGHLSSQPMGALRDFVAHDPTTERAAVVNFPVLVDNPYKIDVPAACELIDRHRPELIIFGKSMVLHREPVAEVRAFLDAEGIDAVVMYDMAHVLGLVGPHFQQPFAEGADLVTGSTHKTYFGPQRGLVAADVDERSVRHELWEAIRRRTFPGAVSNHHLGTMLGLLMAAYEMNHFRDEYQQAVLANAKTLAAALVDCGLDVAGDPAIGYTETHQVIVRVGYGQGPEVARRLEDNNIICNYQAAPDEEGFSAAGALRLGVSEMTRFAMAQEDFQNVAQLIYDVVIAGRNVKGEVAAMRQRFAELKFCFTGQQYDDAIQKLHSLI